MSTYPIVRYKTQNQSSTEHDNSDKFPKKRGSLYMTTRIVSAPEVGNLQKDEINRGIEENY